MTVYFRPYRRPRSGISDQLPVRLYNRAFFADADFPLDHPYLDEVWAELIGVAGSRAYRELAATVGQKPFRQQVVDVNALAAAIGVDTDSSAVDALFEILWRLASYDLGYFVRRSVRRVPTTVFYVTANILAAPACAVAAHKPRAARAPPPLLHRGAAEA